MTSSTPDAQEPQESEVSQSASALEFTVPQTWSSFLKGEVRRVEVAARWHSRVGRLRGRVAKDGHFGRKSVVESRDDV